MLRGRALVVSGLAQLRERRHVRQALQHAVEETRVAEVAQADSHGLPARPLHVQLRQLLLRQQSGLRTAWMRKGP